MQRTRFALLGLCTVALLFAHPMGNFSVNHYSRIVPHDGGADLLYVLDFAEIPTFELLQKWNLQADSPREVLDGRATADSHGWLRNLRISSGDAQVQAQFISSRMTLADGVGGFRCENPDSAKMTD